ncbi:MAG: GNAT family N-acetyltransferase [Methanosarcinaceae archaeon]
MPDSSEGEQNSRYYEAEFEMDIIQENLSVNMIRDNLAEIPGFELPPDFELKWYEPGDEQRWIDIHLASEKHIKIDAALFQREFNQDEKALAQRQCFLLDAKGKALGTATAWFDNDYYGQPFGRIHWVAIIPEMQGKGLAKPLMTTVCTRLSELGHERVYLATSTARIPAINLYLKFGFRPEIRNAADSQTWQAIEKLRNPCLNLETLILRSQTSLN